MMVVGSSSSIDGLSTNTTSTANDNAHLYIPGTTSSFDIGSVASSSVNEAVIILPRSELDRANKDKRHYSEDFQVTTVTINSTVTILIHMTS